MATMLQFKSRVERSLEDLDKSHQNNSFFLVWPYSSNSKLQKWNKRNYVITWYSGEAISTWKVNVPGV